MAERTGISDRLKMAAMLLLSRPTVSRMVGRLAALEKPRWLVQALIRWYIRKMDIDLTEVAQPPTAYPSLSHFFIRKLKTDARPIHPDPMSVVSPVDAEVITAERIHAQNRSFQIKGRAYCLTDLLPPDTDPVSLENGQVIQLYLSPRDYHRIHSPAAGTITGAWFRRGRLLPVNHFSLQHFRNVLVKNERVILRLATDRGPLILSLIGALNVGRIGLTFSDFVSNRNWRRTSSPIPIRNANAHKGQELGYFVLGSTVVMVAPDSLSLTVRAGDRVKMGQEIGRWQDRSGT